MNGLDLDIHLGEVFCLLGSNSAGKTTTVEILEGLRRRSDGDVRVLGRDPAEHQRDWRARGMGGRQVLLAASGPLAGFPPDTTVEHGRGGEVRLGTKTPMGVMDALLSWARAAGVTELPGLRIYRPTLEEIYLDLIHRHSEDQMEASTP